MSALADARRAYLDQPANFGTDGHAVRVAEADAFTAGWQAALGYRDGHVIDDVEEAQRAASILHPVNW